MGKTPTALDNGKLGAWPSVHRSTVVKQILYSC